MFAQGQNQLMSSWDCVSLVKKNTEVCLESLQDVGTRVTGCRSCGICERRLCRGGKLQRQLQRNKMPSSSFLPSSQLCQCLLPNGHDQKQSAKEPIRWFAEPSFPKRWEQGRCSGHLTCALIQGSALKRAPRLVLMLPCQLPWNFNLKTESHTFISHSPCKMMWLVSQTGTRRGRSEADSQEENARAAVCQLLSSKFITTWVS